jgi:hypothetical protein
MKRLFIANMVMGARHGQNQLEVEYVYHVITKTERATLNRNYLKLIQMESL